MSLATLRSNLETTLAGRVPSPFTYRDRKIVETISTGIPEIDSLAGGLPQGSLTEICGPPCSGRTTLLVSALAMRTAQSEVCALIDGRDAFDPRSAEAAGVKLNNLLWVRCRNVDQSLRATDLLLQGGGFGMIVLDLSDISSETMRHVPLNLWFRFQRAVENTSTVLMLMEQESNAKTCAALVLRLDADFVRWKPTGETSDLLQHPSMHLLDGFQARAEVLRSRIKPVTAISTHHGFTAASVSASAANTAHPLRANSEAIFGTQTLWSDSDCGLPVETKPK